MRVFLSMITGVAALGFASGLGAQEKKATEVERAAIGVQLSPTGTARDTLGVFISRVTPKGPAENAGIVEGDRIVSINGIDLRVNAADAGDSYAAGLPSRRLTREVAKLSPGATVNLRVWSGGRIRDVQVTTGRASDLGGGGFYGLLEGGAPGGVFRTMPLMENMRVPMEQLRSLDGARIPLEKLRSMENMRVPMEQMRSFDKLRSLEGLKSLEGMRAPMERLRMHELPQMRFDELSLPSRMRIEGMPRLKDGEYKIRIYSPHSDDVGVYRTYIIGPGGELKLDKSDAARKTKESAEKAKKESTTKK